MSEVIFVEYLKSFGLTGQEAVIYEVLLKNEAMTGYEVAKETGISRSNVYNSMSGLVEKGAAYQVKGNPVRYVCVSVGKFCDHTLYELEQRADYLKEHAPKPQPARDGYITIQGERHIRDVLRDMLVSCEKRVYFMAQAEIMQFFDKELKRLADSGKKVVLLTEGYELPGAVIYQTKPEEDQIRMIIDSSKVLTGELRGSNSDTCLYSGQANLIAVMKEALKNKITLIEMNKED